jgi:hypothetical protein
MMSVHWVKADIRLRASRSDFDPSTSAQSPRVVVVKSLPLIGAGPVGLVHTQKSQVLKKEKTHVRCLTSVAYYRRRPGIVANEERAHKWNVCLSGIRFAMPSGIKKASRLRLLGRLSPTCPRLHSYFHRSKPSKARKAVGSPQNLQLRTFTVSSRSRPISHEIVNAMPCQIIDELEVLTLSP